MTSEAEFVPQKRFIRCVLPWLVAAGAMFVYLATLNHWVTATSVWHVARIGDWDWQPSLYPPVYFVITAPFRLLPATMLPIALNVFAAACATLTLALLARSVALLPHDRTEAQRERESSEFSFLSIRSAWLPPVFAALVCGLQLTFWENAVAASSEIFDLLLFAYVIRCLLEYRVEQNETWLTRFAIIYGASMANNWAMVGFLPLFLAAFFWIKGRGFLDSQFLIRAVGCGLIGLLFYLLLPLVFGLSSDSPANFWQVLRGEFGAQKYLLANMPYQMVWVLGMTSLLPILVIGIRWAASFGDSSPMGVALAKFTFHVAHAGFLIACILVAFDPPFSPRQTGIPLPFLTLYYLGALSIGYFTGYFLLVFGKAASRRPSENVASPLNRIVTVGIFALCLLVPIGLLYKNLPQIQFSNNSLVKDYGSLAAKSLPADGAVVLSDDNSRLFFLKAVLDEHSPQNKFVLLNTSVLQFPQYFRYLEKKYPQALKGLAPTNSPSGFIGTPELIDFLSRLLQKQHVYYLHPSYGYYFERFYLRPHGIAYEVAVYPTNSVVEPPLAREVIAENQSFWTTAENLTIAAVARALTRPKIPTESGIGSKFMRKLHLVRETDKDALTVAAPYSQALNHWGIVLQKNGQLEEASRFFARAEELNPNNTVARTNLACNQNLRTGKKITLTPITSAEDTFAKYHIGENGLFDEPNFCLEQGRVFAQGKLFRQAAQQFERVRTLAPDNLAAQFWLAQFYSACSLPDRVLEIVAGLRPQMESGTMERIDAVQLGYLEAVAYFRRNEPDKGTVELQRVVNEFPDDENLLAAATLLYLNASRFSNALDVIEKHLKVSPDNTSALINKGFICIQLNSYDAAIASLSQALSLQSTNYEALLNRAIAYLRNGNNDAAQADYEVLKKVLPTTQQIYFGLGEIAYRKKDVPAAIQNYELYLSYSPTNNPESKFILARLNELKSSR